MYADTVVNPCSPLTQPCISAKAIATTAQTSPVKRRHKRCYGLIPAIPTCLIGIVMGFRVSGSERRLIVRRWVDSILSSGGRISRSNPTDETYAGCESRIAIRAVSK